MKNKGLIFFLIILAVAIVALIAYDYSSKRPNKREPNPYSYNIEELKNVDPSLIKYKESKKFKIGFDKPTGITVCGDKIYVTGDRSCKIIDFAGKLLNEIKIDGSPKTVETNSKKILVATENKILVFTPNGEMLDEWDIEGEKTYITAIAENNGDVFVADAGGRRILLFTDGGQLIRDIKGEKSSDVGKGFIVPSPYFDIAINNDGELWVANPGIHAMENYTFDGKLRAFWENTSMRIDGFSGCCNPAHFTFLPGGSFVTSEKGLVRIKIHKPSGEFLAVVAPPTKFKGDLAPDVTVDSMDNVYALDFNTKMIRLFEPKTSNNEPK